MKKCNNCQFMNPNDSLFCSKCGSKLEEPIKPEVVTPNKGSSFDENYNPATIIMGTIPLVIYLFTIFFGVFVFILPATTFAFIIVNLMCLASSITCTVIAVNSKKKGKNDPVGTVLGAVGIGVGALALFIALIVFSFELIPFLS